MHRFDVKTINNVQWRRKIFKTTQNYKIDQITMNCFYLTSKRSKQLKTTNSIKLRSIGIVWDQNNPKCWDTSRNIQNNANQRNWSNYSALHRFDVKTINNVQWRRKIFKTTQNYKIDQITMNCFYLMSKRSKQLKTTNSIKLRPICIVWHQNNPKCWDTSRNIQNNGNQRNWSNYNALHRFDF